MHPARTFLCLCLSAIGSYSYAQSPSEASCNTGNAEACFYTGAEYAQGQGVAENKQTAVQFFLKSCELGIPDGCSTSGYLVARGEDNLQANAEQGTQYMEQACAMGHVDGCSKAIGYRMAQNYPTYNLQQAVVTAKKGCNANVRSTCVWGARWSTDGDQGKYPSLINADNAAWFSERGCGLGDQESCIYAERVFSDPQSPLFDAQKSMIYTTTNCHNNSAVSCNNASVIFLQIEDYPEAIGYMKKACEQGHQSSCSLLPQWEKYLADLTAYQQYQQQLTQQTATIDQLINNKQFGNAVATAIDYRSSTLAEKATLAAARNNGMNQISTDNLYIVAFWFSSGEARAAADKEMAARGTGLEGTFGTGTNAAGMADARWKAQHGNNMPRAGTSYNNPASSKPVLNFTEASRQTREKYRHVHCTMNKNNASNYSVCGH